MLDGVEHEIIYFRNDAKSDEVLHDVNYVVCFDNQEDVGPLSGVPGDNLKQADVVSNTW